MKVTCPHCTTPFQTESFGAQTCPTCRARIEDPVLFASTLQTGSMGTANVDAVVHPGMRLGRYEVAEKIGQGGMGAVWRGKDVELARSVAIKTIRADGADAEAVERFFREARASAVLDHPNIVRVHDVGAENGVRYFVMEHVEGRSLSHRIDDEDLAPAEAARIVRDIARALDFAHQKGILHRDVKPSNILLAPDGAPKLADFGLTKTLGEGGDLTATSEVIGTPNYMSPEQARATRNTDVRSDVYSLGAVLYETLTGLPPFRGTTPLEVLRQVEREDPIPPSRMRKVPRDLEVICMKAMAKEPGRRYPTAGEFGDDLDRFLRGEPIRARPASALLRVRRWVVRHPVFATATLTVLLAAVVVGGLLWRAHLDQLARDRADRVRAERELAVRDAVERARVPFETAQLMDDPGTRARRRELLEESMAIVAAAKLRYPDAAMLHFWNGQILEALGRRDDSLAAYGEAIRLDPQFADARFRRLFLRFIEELLWRTNAFPYVTTRQFEELTAEVDAIARCGRQDQVEAARALQAMADLYHYAPEDFEGEGLVERYTTRLPTVEEHAGSAIDFNPVNVEARILRAHGRLSRLLLEHGMGRESLPEGETAVVREDLDRAVRLRPNDALVRHMRLNTFLLMGETEAAAQEAEHVIQIAPEDDDSYLARAMVRMKAGDEAGAWEDFDRALELTTDVGRVRSQRAMARAGLLGTGMDLSALNLDPANLTAAREEIEEALRVEPPYPPARFYRAILRVVQSQDVAGALEDLRAYMEMEPENPIAHMIYQSWSGQAQGEEDAMPAEERARQAIDAARQGRWVLAMQYAGMAVERLSESEARTPEQQQLLGEIYFILACGLANRGQPEEAIQLIESAVAEGWRDWDRLLNEPLLEGLRRDPRFPGLLERWRGGPEF